MQTADREEYEAQLGKLCAGYNLPVTTHRKDAYWSGLAKMSLAQFARCVDDALSDDGPEEMPTVKGVWKIHRELRSARTFEQPKKPEDTRDHLEYWANRLLLAHITRRLGLKSTSRFEAPYGLKDCVASPELDACRKLKRELVDWFLGPIRDGDPDVTPAEFLRQWIAGLQGISRIEKAVYDNWCAMIERPEYNQPFDPAMARELAPETQGRALVPA